MTDGKKLIENLLRYAQDNLHTAEEDCRFLRVLLYRRLGILFVPSDALPTPGENLDLATVYGEVLTYVIENELTKKYEGEVGFQIDDAYVAASIFGLITPLSSYLNRTFKTFREKLSAKKACDFFYEILENGTFVPRLEYAKAEVKDKQDKKEIPYHTEIYTVVSSTGIPAHNAETENNFRYLTFDFEDKKWNFTYVSDAEYYRQGLLTLDDKTIAFSSDIIDGVLDFCDYIPGCFTAARLVSCDGGYSCSDFSTGEYLPLFAAKTQSGMNNENYPDVEVEIVDYPQPCLRLSSFNRNTLSSFVSEIIAAYKNYVPHGKDEEETDETIEASDLEKTSDIAKTNDLAKTNDDNKTREFENAGDACKTNDSATVETLKTETKADYAKPATKSITMIFRIASDNRYSVNLVFGEDEKENSFAFPSPYDTLFQKTSIITRIAGRFNLTKSGREEVLNAVDVLTKKTDLPDYHSDSVLYNDVMSIIEKNGFSRDAKKAEYEVYERLYTLAEETLSANSVFLSEDGSNVPFKSFLAVAGIK